MAKDPEIVNGMDTEIDNNLSPQGRNRMRTNGRNIESITQTPASGVLNHNPNPGIGDQAAKGVIDIKFAETGVGAASMKSNKMRRAEGVTTLTNMINNPSSKIDRSKNTVRKMGMSTTPGGK